LVRADGTDEHTIGSGSIPTWSPDGKLIASQSIGIDILNADGTGYELLRVTADSVRWSPRGNTIVTGIGREFLQFDLRSGKQSRMFFTSSTISHGYGISPDGLRICYGSPNDGLSVATQDAHTKQFTLRQVVSSGTAYQASWAPDGRRVVFAWRQSPAEKTQLYTLDVDTNDAPRLLPGLDLSRQNVNPDWSPDGKTIVFSRETAMTGRSTENPSASVPATN
jgi:Tol biopolymer transport system component